MDLARALAVFGMFAVHVGPSEAARGDVGGWLRNLSEGRASALFATLAGFSLMLIAGRFAPADRRGRPAGQGPDRDPGGALLAVGTAVTITNFGDAVILNSYAVYFLLALPLLRLPARTLAIIAGVLALVAPQVAYGLRALLSEPILNGINACSVPR